MVARIWTARSSLRRARFGWVMTGGGLGGLANFCGRALTGGVGVVPERTIATVSTTRPRAIRRTHQYWMRTQTAAKARKMPKGPTPPEPALRERRRFLAMVHFTCGRGVIERQNNCRMVPRAMSCVSTTRLGLTSACKLRGSVLSLRGPFSLRPGRPAARVRDKGPVSP